MKIWIAWPIFAIELDKQLRRLKRQAGSAKRYKILKEEERLVNGQLLTAQAAAR